MNLGLFETPSHSEELCRKTERLMISLFHNAKPKHTRCLSDVWRQGYRMVYRLRSVLFQKQMSLNINYMVTYQRILFYKRQMLTSDESDNYLCLKYFSSLSFSIYDKLIVFDVIISFHFISFISFHFISFHFIFINSFSYFFSVLFVMLCL